MLGALRFMLTGGAATLVHMGVALGLLRGGTAPLASNGAAFVVAFLVSFWGHHRFSFAGHTTAPRQAFLRFMVVAGIGFAINETALFWLVQRMPAYPAQALVASTTLAAVGTFVLSRHWAFAHPAATAHTARQARS